MATPRPGSSGALPLRPAMSTASKDSDDAAMSPKSTPKVVSITEPDNVSPLLQSLDGQTKKQYNAGVAKRLSGRPALPASSSRTSLVSQKSLEDLPEAAMSPTPHGRITQSQHHHYQHTRDKLLTQVAEWLQAEKAKRAAKKAKKHSASTATLPEETDIKLVRRSSQSSDSSAFSLEKLQRILENNMAEFTVDPSTSPSLTPRRALQAHTARRRSSARTLSRMASSDTEYQDGDVIVPACDAILDNSRTLGYTGGEAASASDVNLLASGKRVEKERKAWSTFKSEILRLAHTLRLKGWRRVPLENGDDIEVERLSGALTNAVYVVYPPKNLPPPNPTSTGVGLKKPPPKLLLRIYGPQVEHLIDRENELGILRRLARKKIGPRLLGTFTNGRFEEYFESTTLTSADLHIPETSKQIAKRMRELHEGIDLLAQEREDGPFVWRNWDKWVERCELVINYLDDQIISGKAGMARSKKEEWKERGLVCGVEWRVFRGAIDKYRQFLADQYGGGSEINKKLVFAHNDTQYGNILRLTPSGESPLLLPANTHKQLVVIDFEYASANTRGLEFANHFTEWCYNYHDSIAPHACNTQNYPTEEEQRRFIKSYVNHRPQFNPHASATPKSPPASGPGSSISEFLLDSRTTGVGAVQHNYAEEEVQREKEADREVEELMKEARLWRIANSAQWVAWGIVQAKVPELDELEQKQSAFSSLITPPLDSLARGGKEKEKNRDIDAADITAAAATTDNTAEDDDEFDYLGYARDRAYFFWGDIVTLGLVKKEELPESLRGSLRIVPY